MLPHLLLLVATDTENTEEIKILEQRNNIEDSNIYLIDPNYACCNNLNGTLQLDNFEEAKVFFKPAKGRNFEDVDYDEIQICMKSSTYEKKLQDDNAIEQILIRWFRFFFNMFNKSPYLVLKQSEYYDIINSSRNYKKLISDFLYNYMQFIFPFLFILLELSFVLFLINFNILTFLVMIGIIILLIMIFTMMFFW